MTLKEAIEKAGLDGAIRIAPSGAWIMPRNFRFVVDDVTRTDWEVKQEPLVWEGKVEWKLRSDNIVPFGYEPLEWNNEIIRHLFLGKRTRIRVEEIIEDEK